MRLEEVASAALRGSDLRAAGAPRLQATPAWLDLVGSIVPAVANPGAFLTALAAFDGPHLVAAVPLLRTEPAPTPRPFPLDLKDLAFGLWIRAVPFADRPLWLRARASAAFGAALGALSPSLRRALVLHAPLSAISAPMVAPSLPPARVRAAIAALLVGARGLAERENRVVVIPRVPVDDMHVWGGAPEGWIQVPTYGRAEVLLESPHPSRIQQMIRRNRRLLDRLGVAVDVTTSAPSDIPFARLFAEAAARHRDPAPALDDAFFRALGAAFPGAVRYVAARAGRLPLGFAVALDHGLTWEAFKCGMDRLQAGRAPVYLDLIYGRIPALAAGAGAARLDLGPGDLGVKVRYGARVRPMSALVALPRRFRGRAAFAAYLRKVGEGIARLQVANVATTPK